MTTDEEKRRDRELKRTLSARLPRLVSGWERHRRQLDDTDPRIMEYCTAVAADPDAHNLYEILGIVRFHELLDRYAWNRKRVRRFFRFYELLRFSGTHG